VDPEALREIVAAGRLGEAWNVLQDESQHQGSVYDVTSIVSEWCGKAGRLLSDFLQKLPVSTLAWG
jgi:hypothetical protein